MFGLYASMVARSPKKQRRVAILRYQVVDFILGLSLWRGSCLFWTYVQIVRLVQRMAEQLPSNKLQVVFLINNYHEVRNVASFIFCEHFC